jgi:hypothetical protein
MVIEAGLSLITTVGLLILTVRLRKYAPWAPHPKRLYLGTSVGLACAAVLTISCCVWTIHPPLTHVWYPVGPLVLIGNVANIICGVCVLLEFTVEGLIATFLIAINQVLWLLFGILAATVDF